MFSLVVLILWQYVIIHAQSRGFKVVVVDRSSGDTVQLYKESWAVIIGINGYRYHNPLEYAVADAESIRSLLIHKFDFAADHITLLTDTNATREAIHTA